MIAPVTGSVSAVPWLGPVTMTTLAGSRTLSASDVVRHDVDYDRQSFHCERAVIFGNRRLVSENRDIHRGNIGDSPVVVTTV